MNLNDILTSILITKNEMREILSVIDDPVFLAHRDDFSTYPTAIYNYLADLYNENYIKGYSKTFLNEFGSEKYIDAPKQRLDYDISDVEYIPYSTSMLEDIMSDVLNYRIQMKDEDKLNIETEYFPIYPDYLKSLIINTISKGYDDGVIKAHNDIIPVGDVHAPTFSFNTTTNIFTITTDQSEAMIFFSVGLNGVPIRYTRPVEIFDNIHVYYWATIGPNKNIGVSDDPYIPLNYQCYYTWQATEIGPKIYPPLIRPRNDNMLFIEPQNEGVNIQYKISKKGTSTFDDNDGEWLVYSGPIQLTDKYSDDEYYITARTYNIDSISEKVTQDIVYQSVSEPVVYPDSPIAHVSDNGPYIAIECATIGADIYYYVSYSSDPDYRPDESDYVLYNGEFEITGSCTVFTYSVLNNVRSIGISYYTFKYIIPVLKPEDVLFNPDPDAPWVQLSCTTGGSHIWYAYNNSNNYTEVEKNTVWLNPHESVKVIHAYATLGDERSENITVFQFTYYTDNFVLDKPVITQTNNRVMMQSDNVIYYSYTTDGSEPVDPIVGGNIWGGSIAQRGIPIPENGVMRVKAQAMDIIQKEYDGVVKDIKQYSQIEYKVFYFDNSSFDYSKEYLTIQGASAINIDTTYRDRANLYYSYDKVNWEAVTTNVGTLDPERKIYLKATGRLFDRLSFGDGDQVIMSGNILSLDYGDSFIDNSSFKNAESVKGMFEGCVQLVDIQNLVIDTKTIYQGQYKKMFKDCINLVSGLNSLVINDVVPVDCMSEMFSGCTKLVDGGVISANGYGSTSIYDSGCYRMFYGCSNLSHVDFGEISLGGDGYKMYRTFEECFSGCSSLTNVSMTIKDTGENAFYRTFAGCSGMTNCNINITCDYTGKTCYKEMFDGCINLLNFNSLPAEGLAYGCYEYMFRDCKSLYLFGSIGATSINGNRAMYGMFYGCENMTSAPVLMMSSISRSSSLCYMFYGCSKLNYIKALFLTEPNDNYTLNWVKDVSPTGTFVQDEDATWMVVGDNGIPTGWVVSKQSSEPGTISDISISYDKVYISSTGNGNIYYQINGSDGEWILYNGPFIINNGCTIYAKCIDNHGRSGEIFSKDVSPYSPNVVISSNGDKFKILQPSGYQYNRLYYMICEYGTTTAVSGWELFTDEITLYESRRVYARGMKSDGSWSGSTYKDIEIQEIVIIIPEEPVISFDDNTITITCETQGADIYYRLNSSGNYIKYVSPIQITSDTYIQTYSQFEAERSDTVSRECIYEPDTPVVPENPEVECNNNVIYIHCETSGANIYYSFDNQSFTLYTSSIPISEDTTVYTYSELDGQRSETIQVYCEYEEHDYGNDYLTFEILSGGDIIFETGGFVPGVFNKVDLYYKKNNGNWTLLQYNQNTEHTDVEFGIISVNTNDRLLFKANTESYYLTRDSIANYRWHSFRGSARFNVCGNIMSLLHGDNYRNTYYINNNSFRELFRGCTNVVSAEHLIFNSINLATSCYYKMFSGCTYLTKAPKQITNENTIMGEYSCGEMFNGCTSLVKAPILLSTTLAPRCYESMFNNCTSLVNVNNSLPANELKDSCYRGMFSGCTSLTGAPQILATITAGHCCESMFEGCTSLTTAPDLLSLHTSTACYQHMFYNCSNLRYIKCLCLDPIADSTVNTNMWLYNVSSTGTFIKNSEVSWSFGSSGIPNGWDVIEIPK